MPADLMRAVNHAHTILSWQESLSSDEIPPEWMWPLDDELEDWFDEIAEARRERYGLSDDRSGGRRERMQRVPMMNNELAKARRK